MRNSLPQELIHGVFCLRARAEFLERAPVFIPALEACASDTADELRGWQWHLTHQNHLTAVVHQFGEYFSQAADKELAESLGGAVVSPSASRMR